MPRVGVFLLLPIYTRGMGPADFGIFSLMLSLAGLLSIVFRLGLDGALLRFHFDVASRRTAALYWTMAAVTLAAVVVLGLAIVTVAAPAFSAIFAGVPMVPYGWLAVGIAGLLAFQYIPTTWFRAVEKPSQVVLFGFAIFLAGALATLCCRRAARGRRWWPRPARVGDRRRRNHRGAPVGRRPPALDPELAGEGLRFGLPLVPHGVAG